MIVFLEESERARKYQREIKFVVTQQQRETESGMVDFFGDELDTARKPKPGRWDARELWLSLLPKKDDEVRVDEAWIADMAEHCGCLISHLQDALRRLMEEGVLQNVDARRPRPKNVVDYRKRERIRRLK